MTTTPELIALLSRRLIEAEKLRKVAIELRSAAIELLEAVDGSADPWDWFAAMAKLNAVARPSMSEDDALEEAAKYGAGHPGIRRLSPAIERQPKEWLPIATAPKDGTTVLIKLDVAVPCYWDNELQRWVTVRPHHIESMRDPKEWQRTP